MMVPSGNNSISDKSDPGYRILVVDDHEPMRILLKRKLENAGYDVTVAVSGEAALNFLDSHTCDLMLLDILMPEMDGYEVLQRVRSRFPESELPIVMISTMDGDDTVEKSRQMGADDHMVKPIDFDRLVNWIARHISRRQTRTTD